MPAASPIDYLANELESLSRRLKIPEIASAALIVKQHNAILPALRRTANGVKQYPTGGRGPISRTELVDDLRRACDAAGIDYSYKTIAKDP